MSKSMNRGLLTVQSAVLEDLLHFPPDHHIIAIFSDPKAYKADFEFVVEGPSLPEVREGEIMRSVEGEIEYGHHMNFT